jgi:hypothetical protein
MAVSLSHSCALMLHAVLEEQPKDGSPCNRSITRELPAPAQVMSQCVPSKDHDHATHTSQHNDLHAHKFKLTGTTPPSAAPTTPSQRVLDVYARNCIWSHPKASQRTLCRTMAMQTQRSNTPFFTARTTPTLFLCLQTSASQQFAFPQGCALDT